MYFFTKNSKNYQSTGHIETNRDPSKPHQSPLNLIKTSSNPMKPHQNSPSNPIQTPSNPIKTPSKPHQTPSKPHQTPSNLIKPYQNPSKIQWKTDLISPSRTRFLYHGLTWKTTIFSNVLSPDLFPPVPDAVAAAGLASVVSHWLIGMSHM